MPVKKGARGRKRKNVSSSEEEESSLSSSSSSSSEEEEEVVAKKSSSARKKPLAKKRIVQSTKRKKKMVEDDEEELGVTPIKQDENDPGYGDDLIINEQDKLYLNSIPEVEREQVLSERYEKLQRWKEWKALRPTATSSSSAAAAPKPVVPAVQIDSDDDEDVADKRKTNNRRNVEAQQHVSSAESDDEDDEEEQVSEDDEALYGAESEADEDAPPPDLSPIDLKACQDITLTRNQILQWIDYPRFKSGLRGCLVKLNEGETAGYVLKEITKVVLRDRYLVDKEPVMFMLKTRGGAKQKSTLESLAKVSNKPLTDLEFAVFSRLPPLVRMTKHDASRVGKNLRTNLVKFVLSPEHVLKMVEARKFRRGDHSVLQRSFGLNTVGKKNALMQEIAECNRVRARLAKQLEASRDQDDEDVSRILDELKQVNESLGKLELEQERVEATISRESEKRLAKEVSLKLNTRNEERNRENIVQVEHRKHAENTASGGQAKASGDMNPFLRRPTRPQMMWDANKTESKEARQEAADALHHQAKAEANLQVAEATTTTTTTSAAKEEEDTFPMQQDTLRPVQARLRIVNDAPIAQSTATKKFSLDEYRRMKGSKH